MGFSLNALAKLRTLKDGEETTIDGAVYTRLDGDFGREWKVSPHGSEQLRRV